jgi:hypothetical protein
VSVFVIIYMNLQKPSLDPCQDVPAGGRSVTFNKLLRTFIRNFYLQATLKCTLQVTEKVVKKILTFEIHPNNVQKFSSYFTANIFNPHCKDQPVKFVYRKNCSLLSKLNVMVKIPSLLYV